MTIRSNNYLTEAELQQLRRMHEAHFAAGYITQEERDRLLAGVDYIAGGPVRDQRGSALAAEVRAEQKERADFAAFRRRRR